MLTKGKQIMKQKRKDYKIIFEQQKRFLLKSCEDFDKGDENEAIRIAGHLRTVLHDSYQKKNYDTKLLDKITDIKELITKESFDGKKTVLNKLNGVKQKIEQQQKKQILSKSLLTQLNRRDKVKFIDTTIPKDSFALYTITNGSLVNTTIVSKSYFGLLAKEVKVLDGKEQVKYQPLCLHENFNSYLINCPKLDFEDWWHKEIYNDGKGTVFSRKDLVTFVANHDGYAHIDERINNNYQNFKDANILDNFMNSNKKDKVNLATLTSVRQIAFETLMTLNDIK